MANGNLRTDEHYWSPSGDGSYRHVFSRRRHNLWRIGYYGKDEVWGKGIKPMPVNEKSLETWLWDAACVIRGEKDAPKYKDYILPLWYL